MFIEADVDQSDLERNRVYKHLAARRPGNFAK